MLTRMRICNKNQLYIIKHAIYTLVSIYKINNGNIINSIY